jgi:hypothetical protein
MYITIPSKDRNEVWAADIDGGNKTKIATGESLATGMWSSDSSRLAFIEGKKRFAGQALSGPDRREQPAAADLARGTVQNVLLSPDQKTVYLNSLEKTVNAATIPKQSVEGSTPEKVSDGVALLLTWFRAGSTCSRCWEPPERSVNTSSRSPTESAPPGLAGWKTYRQAPGRAHASVCFSSRQRRQCLRFFE